MNALRIWKRFWFKNVKPNVITSYGKLKITFKWLTPHKICFLNLSNERSTISQRPISVLFEIINKIQVLFSITANYIGFKCILCVRCANTGDRISQYSFIIFNIPTWTNGWRKDVIEMWNVKRMKRKTRKIEKKKEKWEKFIRTSFSI